jgi:hypothetical protein
MLSAAIAYQVLRQESPGTIEKVIAVLEKHPWYENQWRARLQDVPAGDHGLVLFMQAARWPDDVRFRDKQQHRGPWHYINSALNLKAITSKSTAANRSQGRRGRNCILVAATERRD